MNNPDPTSHKTSDGNLPSPEMDPKRGSPTDDRTSGRSQPSDRNAGGGSPNPTGSGENPTVEDGRPENGPERPKFTDEQRSEE